MSTTNTATPIAPTVLQAPALKQDEGRTLHTHGKIERRIVWNLLNKAAAAGFIVTAVHDGEERVKCNSDMMAAMETVFSVDVSTLCLKKPGKGYSEKGVALVCGNGEDIVSDWSFQTDDADGFNAFMDAFISGENF